MKGQRTSKNKFQKGLTIGVENRVRELRQEKRMNIYELSNATGVNGTTISKYEELGGNITLKSLVPLADFFGVSIDYLEGRTSERVEAAREINTDSLLLLKKQAISEGNAFVYRAIEQYERNNDITIVFKALQDQTKLVNSVMSVPHLTPNQKVWGY